jgi:membrane fusion protein, copper/silver efflux system
MPRPGRVVIGIVLASAIFFAGYAANRRPQPTASPASARPAVTYACPMHPQYTSDRPGDCPLCGMRLEPVSGHGSQGPSSSATSGAVVVGQAGQQLIGIRTDDVRLESSSQVLRVPGRIAVDQQRLYRIVAAVDGWILDLRDNTVGRFVKKDQLLGSYYTRDLLSTERLFLLSIPANEPLPTQTRDFSQASIRTAGSANPQYPIDNLRGLGMADIQIDEIHTTRTASPYINIYSPVSGFVLERTIAPKQWFDKGSELYRIADISRVWVWTDIFEKDRQFLHAGAEATVVYQGRRLRARMSEALPQFDPQSRTLKTRFELENPDNLLQPEMFVDVELDVPMAPAMTVPADAVFDSGRRKTVFVDRGNGSFEARRIETGWRLGDRVEITKGLMEGERVVASANFLLDSESRMRAASAGILNPESDIVCGMEVDGKRVAAAGHTATHEGHTYYFCSDECKKKFEAEPAKYIEPHRHEPAPATAKASAPPQAAAARRTMVKDPVCGMDLDPKDPAIAARKVDYDGKSYYFCSDECKRDFLQNPTAYVK